MFKPTRRQLLATLLATAAGASQAFPDKTVKIIVPFSAGSVTDALARDLGQALAPIVKQTVLVDNRAGAEGSIGAQAVLADVAGGHTVMLTSSSQPVLDPLLKKGLPYDPVKDFVPVCAVARIGNVMNMNGALPYKNIAEFLAAARAQPGKFTFAYSTATTRLAGELFQQQAKVQLTGVPYKSTVAGLIDVAGGTVDLFFVDHVSAGPQYQNGRIRPLLVSGAKRLPSLPDVPSATEAGIPGYEMSPWFGVFMPAKAPPAAVNAMRTAVSQALKTPSMALALQKASVEPFTICGDEVTKYQMSDIQRMSEVVKKANIQPQ